MILIKIKLIDQFDFDNYTDHFRDPFLFVFKNNYYFLLGAQTKKGIGVILLFSLNKKLDHPQLIKEIHVDNQFKMIECPSLFFKNNLAYLIYCPQYKQMANNINPDICRYSQIDIDQLLNNNQFVVS